MGGKIFALFLFLFFVVLVCGIVRIGPAADSADQAPPTEINAVPAPQTEAPQLAASAQTTPTLETAQTDQPQPGVDPRQRPLHGLRYAFLIPFLVLGLPWIVIEYFIVRYVQPRGVDVAKVLVKAQDGLFLEAAVSMTARRTVTLASTRMTWGRVRDFVEKIIEQELIHAATSFSALEDLERNLKMISDAFIELPLVTTLSRDFGVHVLWFNIEIRYPQETIDALQRKADASAGGTAYLAFAAAAHLNPDSRECRELYTVYQQTSGQVDAARNLGGGITTLAELFARKNRQPDVERDDDTDT